MRVSHGGLRIAALALAVSGALALSAGVAMAHGSAAADTKMHDGAMRGAKGMRDARYANAEEHAFGVASDPARAVLSIEVGMHDALRFEPAVIEVRRGEPVRFVVSNRGNLMHEMVLGTPEDLERHAALMRRFPGMEHDEPYMAHVAPGAHGEMGWTFTQPGEYVFACLVPGHYEGGMVGRIVVR